MCEKGVFAHEPCRVAVGSRLIGEQSCLTEEQGLDRGERVAVLAQKWQWHRLSEPLHRVGVDAESECAREGDVGGLFPVARQGVEQREQCVGLGIGALMGEGGYPCVEVQGVDGRELGGAGQVDVRTVDQAAVALVKLWRTVHRHLRDDLAVAPLYGAVVAVDDVEDD